MYRPHRGHVMRSLDQGWTVRTRPVGADLTDEETIFVGRFPTFREAFRAAVVATKFANMRVRWSEGPEDGSFPHFVRAMTQRLDAQTAHYRDSKANQEEGVSNVDKG